MSKITLTEATKIIRNTQNTLTDAFASEKKDSIAEDLFKLRTVKDLLFKVFVTEKAIGIDSIRNQINLLVVEENYRSPQNLVWYYKDNIPKQYIDDNYESYNATIKSIEALKTKIKEISDKVYIEVD